VNSATLRFLYQYARRRLFAIKQQRRSIESFERHAFLGVTASSSLQDQSNLLADCEKEFIGMAQR
jgi:hypothetical protein